MNKSNIYILLLGVIGLFASCKADQSEFDNKLYINARDMVSVNHVSSELDNFSTSIELAVPMPLAADNKIGITVDESKVDRYNLANDEKGIILPKEYYQVAENDIVILKNNNVSNPLNINFNNLSQLDRSKVYVLPISIVNPGTLNVLESASTKYYVFKAGALINVVADIDENYLSIQWQNKEPLNNLGQLTMEALIRAKNFDRMISSIMGIEGSFLIRLGDSGFPSNQIQVSVARTFFPGADASKGLPTNEWVHIAMTYDENAGMQVFVNGTLQSKDETLSFGKVNLGSTGFYIGKSWDDERYFSGDIAECRIWNVVRTKDEIANNPYSVNPNSEGLVAYWKFSDGAGNVVKDHSSNHNDAVANKDLTWTPVSLPAKN